MRLLRRLTLSQKKRSLTTIKQISAQKAQITVLIAHRLSTIMHADCIFVLEKGQIVETTAHTRNCLMKRGYTMPCGGSRSAKKKICRYAAGLILFKFTFNVIQHRWVFRRNLHNRPAPVQVHVCFAISPPVIRLNSEAAKLSRLNAKVMCAHCTCSI